MLRKLWCPLLLAALASACAPPPPPEAEPGRLIAPKQPRASAPCRSSADLRCIVVIAPRDDVAAANAATVIGDDLAFSERFAVLRDAAGAELIASVSIAGARTLKLEVKDSQRTLLTQEIPIAKSPRTAAHQAADLIAERITGVRGVAATSIAYVERINERGTPLFRLSIADADGSNVTVVAESREPLLSPTWSPDASQIAWMGYDHGPSAIFLKDLRNGAVRKLVSESTAASAPAFSPDGRTLAFSLNGRSGSDLYAIELASGARRSLTESPGIDTEPSWSPDGSTIAFTSDRAGAPQVYAMPAGGGSARVLSHGIKQALRPCYAPEGRSLALVVLEHHGFRVALMDIASGRLREIGSGPGDESPSFAPNGKTLIYVAQAGDHGELVAASLDRGSERRLRPGADVRAAAWSPYRR